MKNQKHILQFSFLIFFALSLMLYACSKKQNNNPERSGNYVILLDLSDRLLAPHQDEQDIEIILTVFNRFENEVYKKLIVNSKDRFSVRILSQDKSQLDTDSLNNLLTIDMATFSMKEKKEKLIDFKKQFAIRLKHIYQEAGRGTKPSDYQGVDIWRYFNENLRYDLLDGYNNHLLILTDGYFDFESYQYTKRKDNRFSSTIFFQNLRRDDWKTYAERKDYGLLPVNQKFPETVVIVAGIHPKNKSLDQTGKLIYFWEKWLKEMKFHSYMVIKKNNSEQIKEILRQQTI